MVAFYADEQFPLEATQHLRLLGHDVQTVQEAGNANQKIADDKVLLFATAQSRAVLTLNRRDFIRLHRQGYSHSGIVVVKDEADKIQLAERINRVVKAEGSLTGQLVRVTKLN